MRIECPSCHFSADVAPEKLPPKGGNARCPRCSELFFVPPPPAAQSAAKSDQSEQPQQPPQRPSAAPAAPAQPAVQAAKVICPKCEAEQEPGETCQCCGLIFQKYKPASSRRLPASAPEAATASAEAAPVNFSFGSGRNEIVRWVQEGRLDSENAAAALRLTGAIPDRQQWRRFLDCLALWLGAIFLAAAVIFFFAYNWRELGRFARFGLVEILLAAAVLTAWRTGLDKMAGKASLWVASLMVGALLALVGQTYQTGADPWELFASWAIMVLPWVALSRFAPMWLLWVVLLNLSVKLYHHVFAGLFGLIFGTLPLWWTLAALNTAALVVWEVAALRALPWLSERWPQRLLATAGAGYVTIIAASVIIDQRSATPAVHIIGYLAWIACAYAVYRHKIRDLYVLALGILSLIVVVTVWLADNLLDHDSGGAFLAVGMAVLGMSAAGGWWLRNVAREVEA